VEKRQKKYIFHKRFVHLIQQHFRSNLWGVAQTSNYLLTNTAPSMPTASKKSPTKSLNRLLSQRGICSRKEAELLIRLGKVRVNGKVCRLPFEPVSPSAVIAVEDTERDPHTKELFYVVMNKRKGLITTWRDERQRETVYDDLNPFLKREGCTENLYAVGRLDKDTDGLLLFTNDTHFAEFVTNPTNTIPKTYLAKLIRPITDDDVNRLAEGMTIDVRGETFFAKPHHVQKLKPALVTLTLTEGKNREVRRLFDALNHKVEKLTRIGFAKLDLATLALEKGEARFIRKEEIVGI
jgi:23S rRNA pseudouridine2605 synthase